MSKHAKPTNIHPLLPKVYRNKVYSANTRKIHRETIVYLPLPFKLGLVKYPFRWTKAYKGCYGLTGIEIRSRYWALFDWADHADFDDRGDYILRNIRERNNGSVRVK